jgi:hypothetical protein
MTARTDAATVDAGSRTRRRFAEYAVEGRSTTQKPTVSMATRSWRSHSASANRRMIPVMACLHSGKTTAAPIVSDNGNPPHGRINDHGNPFPARGRTRPSAEDRHKPADQGTGPFRTHICPSPIRRPIPDIMSLIGDNVAGVQLNPCASIGPPRSVHPNARSAHAVEEVKWPVWVETRSADEVEGITIEALPEVGGHNADAKVEPDVAEVWPPVSEGVGDAEYEGH